jgi:hypothetical protein
MTRPHRFAIVLFLLLTAVLGTGHTVTAVAGKDPLPPVRKAITNPADTAKQQAPSTGFPVKKRLDRGILHDRLALPDLSVHKVALTGDCKIAITLRNNGPGRMPDAAWSSSRAIVDYNIDGGAWGGMTLNGFDHHKRLQPAGGMYTFVSDRKVAGTSVVKAHADRHGIVAETNERNNGGSYSLTCRMKPHAAGESCCVAGDYRGELISKASDTCIGATRKEFVFAIYQDGCADDITGEMLFASDADGIYAFTGRITRVVGCCRISGTLVGQAGTPAAGRRFSITATLCFRDGRYAASNGSFSTTPGCRGKLIMESR